MKRLIILILLFASYVGFSQGRPTIPIGTFPVPNGLTSYSFIAQNAKADTVWFYSVTDKQWVPFTHSGSIDGITSLSVFATPNSPSDQSTQLQAAINYAQANHKILVIPAGTFITSQRLHIDSSNFVMIGQGGNSIIKAVDATGAGGASRCVIQVNAKTGYTTAAERLSNIVLKDFVVDMSGIPTLTSSSSVISNWNTSTYFGWGSGGIAVAAVDNIFIQNVQVNNAYHGGFWFQACSHLTLDRSQVNGVRSYSPAGQPGIVFNGNAITATSSFNTPSYTGLIGDYNITNCSISGTTGNFPDTLTNRGACVTFAGVGIEVQTGTTNPAQRQVKGIRIVNNYVEKCGTGILMEGITDGGAGNSIASENFVRNNIRGIVFQGNGSKTSDSTFYASIINNHVDSTQLNAIESYGHFVNISNNQIKDWGLARKGGPLDTTVANGSGLPNASIANAIYVQPYGIDDTATLATAKGINISNNTAIQRITTDTTNFLYVLSGIRVDLKSWQTLNGLQISHNTVYGGKSTGYRSGIVESGLVVQGHAKDVIVSDNIFTGFAGNGARFTVPSNTGTNFNAVENLSFHNNKVFDNYWRSGTGNTGWELIVQTGNPRVDISNNDFYETSGARVNGAVQVPQQSGTDANIVNFSLVNNKGFGFAFGDINIWDINLNSALTTTDIRNNSGRNVSNAVPTSTIYQRYKGEIVWNNFVTTNYPAAWVCVATGKPGTWQQMGAAVDTTLADGSTNAISNNAVFDALKTKFTVGDTLYHTETPIHFATGNTGELDTLVIDRAKADGSTLGVATFRDFYFNDDGNGVISIDTNNIASVLRLNKVRDSLAALSGSGGNPNSNIGSGYRWAVPNTNNIKTLFAGSNKVSLDSTTNTNGITIDVNQSNLAVSESQVTNLVSDLSAKEPSFTEKTQEFTGSTSMSITLSNTPKSGKAEMYYLNGIVIKSSNISRTGTSVTLSGFTRESSDVITAKYSY